MGSRTERCLCTKRAFVVAAAVVLAAAPAGLTAQEAPDSTTSVKARLLMGLGAGPRVRLYSPRRGGPVEGTLIGLDGSSASVDEGERVTSISLAEVERIQVWDEKTGRGAGIGALVAGLVGAGALGFLTQGLCDAADCSGEWVGGAAIGGAVGALVGGLVGAFVGSGASGWEPVFP